MEIKQFLNGAMLLTSTKRTDPRGTTRFLFTKKALKEAGIDFYIEDLRVYTMLEVGTIYGIHFQTDENPMAKLITVIQGSGIDYVVDLRPDSPTYLKWEENELSAENGNVVYVPHGFGHAFLSLEKNTIQVYAADATTTAETSGKLNYLDPKIALDFPTDVKVVSPGDQNAPFSAFYTKKNI